MTVHARLDALAAGVLRAAPGAERLHPHNFLPGVSSAALQKHTALQIRRLETTPGTSVRVIQTDDGSWLIGAVVRQPWDSARLGVSCAKLVFFGNPNGDCAMGREVASVLDDLIGIAQRQGVGLVNAKVAADTPLATRLAHDERFELVNEEIVFLASETATGAQVPEGISIDCCKWLPVTACEFLDVEFPHSRFHRDRHIDRRRADALWRQSLVNAARGEYDELIAACSADGRAHGIVACRDDGLDGMLGGVVRDFFLVAVAGGSRGRGVATALVAEAARRSHVARWITVSTQTDNVVACRVYAKAGFVPRQRVLNYHLWLGPAQPSLTKKTSSI
jgi:ribosomal protein S18 acetylase RimI-like enzyme